MLRAPGLLSGFATVFVVNLLIGLVMLVAGAEMLVRGGGQLALALRVPALVVGLTIVAFGTSSPELIVSVTAALEASTEMALANVIGSNIANILLVLGLAAVGNGMQMLRHEALVQCTKWGLAQATGSPRSSLDAPYAMLW